MEWKRVKRVNCNHNSLFVGTHHFFVLCCCITIAIVFALQINMQCQMAHLTIQTQIVQALL